VTTRQALVPMLILAILLLMAVKAEARPMTERSNDGMFWRLVNPDPVAYYCWLTLGDGTEFENIVYAHSVTRWYPARGGFEWDCSS
jgi:hypothetical protein